MKVIMSSKKKVPETIGAVPKKRMKWEGEIRLAYNNRSPILQPILSHDPLWPTELREWLEQKVTKPLFKELGIPSYFRIEMRTK